MGEDSEGVKEAFLTWLSPRAALERLKEIGNSSECRRALLDRCRSGLLMAGAATYVKTGRSGGETSEYVVVPRSVWQEHAPTLHDDFWNTGSLHWGSLRYNSDTQYAVYGVRFDPAGIAKMLTDAGLDVPSEPASEITVAPTADERPPLAKVEYERFCRAIIAGWGNEVTQDWAYEKAVLFFADKRVARDNFRSILRSIRGPMKPGKRGKTEE